MQNNMMIAKIKKVISTSTTLLLCHKNKNFMAIKTKKKVEKYLNRNIKVIRDKNTDIQCERKLHRGERVRGKTKVQLQ
jgi:hypothetical protein